MFKSTLSLLALGLFAGLSTAQNVTTQKIGWTGTLSSLDGGLGGVVTVVDATTLSISMYTLKDASAPALYWWGTTDGVIKDGFRIANKQITEAATTNTLTITLDAGKTTADFTTVGLWCERLNANFGQATLKASGASTTTTAAAGAAATTSAKAGAGNALASYGFASGTLAVASLFASYMG